MHSTQVCSIPTAFGDIQSKWNSELGVGELLKCTRTADAHAKRFVQRSIVALDSWLKGKQERAFHLSYHIPTQLSPTEKRSFSYTPQSMRDRSAYHEMILSRIAEYAEQEFDKVCMLDPTQTWYEIRRTEIETVEEEQSCAQSTTQWLASIFSCGLSVCQGYADYCENGDDSLLREGTPTRCHPEALRYRNFKGAVSVSGTMQLTESNKSALQHKVTAWLEEHTFVENQALTDSQIEIDFFSDDEESRLLSEYD